MTDHMTPLERRQALYQKQAVDRLPVTLFHPEFAAKLAGMSYHESHHTAEALAHREITIYEKMGVDEVSLMYVNLPKTSQTLIRSLDEIDQLSLDDYRFDKDPRQQINDQALQLIHKDIGHEAVISYGMVAPFTLAQGIIPIKALMKGLIKSSDRVHQLLQFCTDFLIYLTDQLAPYPFLEIFLYDPVASGSLVSAKTYEKFCLPYTQQVVDHIKAHYPWRVNMHICGDTSDRLDLFVQSHIDGFSLDQKVDLAFAKEKVGQDLTLMGNVDPVGILLQASPDAIEKAVQDCFEKAQDSPQSFILRSGCGVPYRTPIENIQAYVEAGKKYGRLAVQ